MSKDYKNIKKKKPEPFVSYFSNAMSFLTGLSLGLFVAVIVYFQQYTSIVKNNVLLKDKPAVVEVIEVSDNEELTQRPEPTFDFYKILPNREVSISEWESVEEENASAQQTDWSVMFVLQVGSFKQFEAADEIKAKLALMGVTADIQRVVINGQDVRHRVRIGPYKDSNQLQQTKNRLLANDLDFMLLKLKMEDI